MRSHHSKLITHAPITKPLRFMILTLKFLRFHYSLLEVLKVTLQNNLLITQFRETLNKIGQKTKHNRQVNQSKLKLSVPRIVQHQPRCRVMVTHKTPKHRNQFENHKDEEPFAPAPCLRAGMMTSKLPTTLTDVAISSVNAFS